MSISYLLLPFYLSVFCLETVVQLTGQDWLDWMDRNGSSLIIHALLTSCLIRAPLFCLSPPSITLLCVCVSLSSFFLRGTRLSVEML